MEFKDALKQQRRRKNISQQALADAIFVSRSAVAKWENGLGIPNDTSYAALLEYFALSPEELPLNEQVEVLGVSKNKKIRLLAFCVAALSVLVAVFLTLVIILSISDSFGLTSRSAAGKEWRDEARISAKKYDFYINTSSDSEESGWISEFCAVQKCFVGYKRINIEDYCHALYLRGVYVGKIYIFEAKGEFYYLIPPTNHMYQSEGQTNIILHSFPYIHVGGAEYDGEYNSFFTLPMSITRFSFKNEHYSIKEYTGNEKVGVLGKYPPTTP